MRCTVKTVSSVAVMLVVGSSLFAQDTTKTKPTSSRRIPISKEAPGEVAPAMTKTDTVTVYKTDTLRLTNTTTRVDTVTNTVTRTDTVTVTPPVPPVHLPGGFYIGLGAGMSNPTGAIYDPNSAGPTAQLQLGWERPKSLLGFRVDGNWAHPSEDSFYSGYQADPDIVNLNGDAKLNLPIFNHMFGISPRFKLYGIGGASYIMYKNLPIEENGTCSATCVGPLNVLVGQTTESWQKHWGWNAGGGMSIGWRNTEIFVESRYISWDTNVNPRAGTVPIVLGMNWY
jgi:hypothetical protein